MITSILRTDDDVPLTLHLFEPTRKAVGAVVIVSAMGVPQRFYEPFANWLAEQGLYVMTFDFRGMGLSKIGSLAKVDANIFTWAEKDTSAVLAALAEKASGLPITWIGHSLGGQIIPFVPNRELAKKIITIATGSGYWRENSPQLKRKVLFLWWGFVPLMTPLLGYFPGKRLGMVGDLPRGVIMQWRRWCLDREYAVGAEGPRARALFNGVRTPITSFSFTDDDMMSDRSISSIHALYTGAKKAMHRFEPKDLGKKRVGHFGFFRRDMEAMWKKHIVPELATTAM